jgi:hypothetical protein
MNADSRNISELWNALKTNGERYKKIWDDISKYSGITVDPDYIWNNNSSKITNPLDDYVDDPTTAMSVNQGGDYLVGIIWGTGDNAFDIVPSRYVLEYADQAELEGWYEFAGDQTLYHMNHSNAGLMTALKPYAYDQFSFGTSGIGAFLNKSFLRGLDDNAFIFRQYGIDNTRIDEGKNGIPEIVFATYQWRVNRIVSEFAMENGSVSEKLLAKLPKAIKDAYTGKDFNKEFKLVNGVYPREDFDPKLKGKRGTRYRGVWFLDEGDCKVFFEEDFSERPIAMCRQIKVRGQVYGKASGTILISTIRSVNFMVGTVIEILEKMSNPSLGMMNNAIFGDSVLDTSPNGLTIFNQALIPQGGAPLFPLYDVGDPSGIIEFLIPYLNSKIVSAFKIDALLDFNSNEKMTATESMQRYIIRGKSISGMLTQQKCELLEPLVKRCVTALYDIGELGVNPYTDEARAEALAKLGKNNRVIPDAVLKAMEAGQPWFEIRFNNELEKLMRTESIQSTVQLLQAVTGIAALYPAIIEAIDWYALLKDINDNLDRNSQILISAKEFKEKLAAAAQAQQAAMALQAGQMAAATQKDGAQAQKSQAEAQQVKSK